MSSFEVLNLSLFDVPDSSSDLIDQVVIVADQEQCAWIPLQREVESINGFQIKMIRGFVQDEKVRFLQHELTENQPGSFAAGKRFGALQRILTAEQHLAKQTAKFFLGGAAVPIVQPLDDGEAWPDGVPVVLREVADGCLVAPCHGACINGELLIGSVDKSRRITDQRFQKRCLPCSVPADQGDLLSAADRGREIPEHLEMSFCTGIRLGQPFEFERMSS